MPITKRAQVKNAVKYSKDNSDIEISFANNNFNISNECDEISKKDLKKIWKPSCPAER